MAVIVIVIRIIIRSAIINTATSTYMNVAFKAPLRLLVRRTKSPFSK